VLSRFDDPAMNSRVGPGYTPSTDVDADLVRRLRESKGEIHHLLGRSLEAAGQVPEANSEYKLARELQAGR
jgi:hypothetical protein